MNDNENKTTLSEEKTTINGDLISRTEYVQPIVREKCYITHGMYENRIWCNNCGFIKVITGEEENYNFCPKCGAIVEESGEE